MDRKMNRDQNAAMTDHESHAPIALSGRESSRYVKTSTPSSSRNETDAATTRRRQRFSSAARTAGVLVLLPAFWGDELVASLLVLLSVIAFSVAYEAECR